MYVNLTLRNMKLTLDWQVGRIFCSLTGRLGSIGPSMELAAAGQKMLAHNSATERSQIPRYRRVFTA